VETKQSARYAQRVMGFLSKFDPDQPRDDSGRFSDTPGGGARQGRGAFFLPTPGMVEPSAKPAPPSAPRPAAPPKPRFIPAPPRFVPVQPRPAEAPKPPRPPRAKVGPKPEISTKTPPEQKSVKASADVMRDKANVKTQNVMPGQEKEYGTGGRTNIGKVRVIDYKDGSKAIYKADAENPTGKAFIKGREEVVRATIKPPPGSADRDMAFYELDRIAEFNITPPTVPGDFGAGPGFAQAFVAGPTLKDIYLKAKAEGGSAREKLDQIVLADTDGTTQAMAALDYIAGNTDRNIGNLILGQDGRLYAIDHNLAFPEPSRRGKLLGDSTEGVIAGAALSRMYSRSQPISGHVKQALGRLTPEKIRAVMKARGFSRGATESAVARRNVLADALTWRGIARFG
jgi:hypothetical protein